MLYLIGLGLSCKGISVEGMEALKGCKKVFLESYTSLLDCSKEELESLLGPFILADRELVEKSAEEILGPAKASDVALLVIGDPLCATTHQDLLTRAEQEGVKVKIIHSASVISAVGITGLQVYKFGKTASIPFPEPNYLPETPYNVLKDNLSVHAHTLFLLDLRPGEDRFMSVQQAIDYLLQVESIRKEGLFTEDTLCVGCARLGQDAFLKAGTAKDLREADFGRPVHCLVVPGKMHFIEEEAIGRLRSGSRSGI